MNKKIKIIVCLMLVFVMLFAFAVNTFAAVKCAYPGTQHSGFQERYKISMSWSSKKQYIRVENVGRTNITMQMGGWYKNIAPGRSYEIGVTTAFANRYILTVQNNSFGYARWNIKTSRGTITVK